MNAYPIMLLADLTAATSAPEDLYRRYELYGETISNLTHEKVPGLFLISGGHSNSFFKSESAHLIHFGHKARRFQSIKAARISAKEIKNRDIFPTMIIAGDPFFGLVSSLILRRYLDRKIPIQVSFHGEITSAGFGKSLKGLLQNLFVRLSMRRIQSVRLVSSDQVDNAKKIYNVEERKIVIAPVPLVTSYGEQRELDTRNKSIAFVGRIHPERGIDTWIETIRNLTSSCSLKIIGDGPLKEEMKRKLLGFSNHSVSFYGYVTQSELEVQWQSISVLLSTAPFESYGMAMREAILHGIPVVSIRNSGATTLFQQCPEMITLVDNSVDASRAVEHYLQHPPIASAYRAFQNSFFEKQSESLKSLAQTWVGNSIA